MINPIQSNPLSHEIIKTHEVFKVEPESLKATTHSLKIPLDLQTHLKQTPDIRPNKITEALLFLNKMPT